jgi:hypothetical protein
MPERLNLLPIQFRCPIFNSFDSFEGTSGNPDGVFRGSLDGLDRSKGRYEKAKERPVGVPVAGTLKN